MNNIDKVAQTLKRRRSITVLGKDQRLRRKSVTRSSSTGSKFFTSLLSSPRATGTKLSSQFSFTDPNNATPAVVAFDENLVSKKQQVRRRSHSTTVLPVVDNTRRYSSPKQEWIGKIRKVDLSRLKFARKSLECSEQKKNLLSKGDPGLKKNNNLPMISKRPISYRFRSLSGRQVIERRSSFKYGGAIPEVMSANLGSLKEVEEESAIENLEESAPSLEMQARDSIVVEYDASAAQRKDTMDVKIDTAFQEIYNLDKMQVSHFTPQGTADTEHSEDESLNFPRSYTIRSCSTDYSSLPPIADVASSRDGFMTSTDEVLVYVVEHPVTERFSSFSTQSPFRHEYSAPSSSVRTLNTSEESWFNSLPAVPTTCSRARANSFFQICGFCGEMHNVKEGSTCSLAIGLNENDVSSQTDGIIILDSMSVDSMETNFQRTPPQISCLSQQAEQININWDVALGRTIWI